MKLESWSRYLVAAVLILVVGAIWALAEETTMKVEVRSEDGRELTIDVNGVKEVVTLEDLAEGEERTFDVGGHEISVKRDGDRLLLVGEDGHHERFSATVTDGEPHRERHVVIKTMGEEGEVDVDANVMFVGEGDQTMVFRGEGHPNHDVFILKDEDGEIDIEALEEKFGEDFEEFYTTDGAHVMKWVDEDDGEPIVIERLGHHGHGDFVTYRCEETGSMLTVKAEEGLLDDYIDPVTGCVMKKVEHTGVRVIKIREKKILEDE
jgi:hypothetical protein